MKKLSVNDLKDFSYGAVGFKEEQDRITFYRFTKEQQCLYEKIGDGPFYLHLKTFTSAGIKLVFKTNSSSLFIKVNISRITTRSYFSYDVYADDKMVGCIDNFSDRTMADDYTVQSYPIGSFSKEFRLGEGVKTVTIYLPWSVVTEVIELSIDDEAFAEPVRRDKKLLIFGDSITHGYDSLRPSKHYTVKIEDYLGADGYNKAVGGEVFFPELARTKEDFVPDYILVAYGTNDWGFDKHPEDFKARCKAFYEILSEKYPASKIFAVTPIWRIDYRDDRKIGDFIRVSNYINEVSAKLHNVYCIQGFDLVPHQKRLYADWGLHPNDAGFAYYAKALREQLDKILKW